jgi:O-antigen ligase
MARKYKASTAKNQSSTPAAAASPAGEKVNGRSLVALIFFLLYSSVHAIPDFGAYDAMGPQWFSMVLIDIAGILYIVSQPQLFRDAWDKTGINLFVILYTLFFIVSGLSIIASINPTEGWVCFARLTATFGAFFVFLVLLFDKPDLIGIIAQLLGLILAAECLNEIRIFMANESSQDLIGLIKDIKSVAGNKNIFSAGLVTKIPFVLYCIHKQKLTGKILNTVILGVGIFTVFLTNARAAYLSLSLIILLYFLFCLYLFRQEKNKQALTSRAGLVFLALVAAFGMSQLELNNAKYQTNYTGNKDFGTVTDRFSMIAETKDESNAVRFRLWAHAADYTLKHPLYGCGYGNWKIASIPYQRTITNDLFVPIHAHNDFIETFAELGLPGGLLYLSMFACLTLFACVVIFSKAAEQIRLTAFFALLALVAYAVDAFFNFPTERPINQYFFALISAIIVTNFIYAKADIRFWKKKEPQTESGVPPPSPPLLSLPAFAAACILTLIPATYITYQDYKSLVVQKTVLGDIMNEPLKLDWKEVVPSFPSIPNLAATAQAVEAIKARYIYEAGAALHDTNMYRQALHMLDKGREANPLVGYSEFLKAGVYFRMGKLDSALINAKIAFETRPRARTYYQTLLAIQASVKDSTGIQKAFDEFNKYRPMAFGWNLYLIAMLQAKGHGTPELLRLADTAIRRFANEGTPEVKELPKRRQDIINTMNVVVPAAADPAASQRLTEMLQQYISQGAAAFGSGDPTKNDLAKAAGYFIKASQLVPDNYTYYENTAMCYFNMHDFKKAIYYFDKSLATGRSADGKSEFFKGVALINLGKQDEGCGLLKISKAKGYKEKEAELDAILKSRCGVQ